MWNSLIDLEVEPMRKLNKLDNNVAFNHRGKWQRTTSPLLSVTWMVAAVVLEITKVY